MGRERTFRRGEAQVRDLLITCQHRQDAANAEIARLVQIITLWFDAEGSVDGHGALFFEALRIKGLIAPAGGAAGEGE